ncbi:MAG: acyl carrier protein [Deltaproteobacteria bacterium]|nr:acyl carrier protein [Deltaproteobacteria bacterium]
MHETQILAGLKAFIVKEMLEGNDEGLEAETPLIELGLINSISLMRLRAYVQREFTVKIPEEALTVSNLASLAALTRLVCQLSARKG